MLGGAELEAFTPKNFDEEVTIERRKTMTPLQRDTALRNEAIVNAMHDAHKKGLTVEVAAEKVAKKFKVSASTVTQVWSAFRAHFPLLGEPWPGES